MTERIDEAFAELEWHDALLVSLNIDRSTPGERDEVALLVEWPDGRKQKVRFTDCYAFNAQMNFGVTAPESIRAARCIADAPKLAEMRQRWMALGVDLGDLWCFEITTNSTASEIRIFAKRFEVSDP
ncbi:hypothetical protein LZ198_24495 [Myxococcus sp. K15C18031901]|uniref:hypothetical protein n=1 Tax=Myxococcus dinghuensis TaxID=2906761 RepID=UPI0020A76892|nr:hypothetical protein [Myxococcus dinghuensis]MCP3102031.1 hypothetical protein [Myxococcus dinghuensis]